MHHTECSLLSGTRRCRLILALFAVCLPAWIGCGSTYKLHKVQGTVKFEDGTVPQGDSSIVRFEPLPGNERAKAASGDIQPDGSFRLTTIEPGDGAFEGEYQVVLTVAKGYPPTESLVPQEYTRRETTPLSAKVARDSREFDFVVRKP